MNSKELREKAIKRYENCESPKEIYQSLGKGKTWFFKNLFQVGQKLRNIFRFVFFMIKSTNCLILE